MKELIEIDKLKKWRADRIQSGDCNFDDMTALEAFIETVERVADTPQGWVDKAISIIDEMETEGIIAYEQAWEFRMRAQLKGADDE